MTKATTKGIFALVGAALFWSISGVVAKQLLITELNFVTLVQLRLVTGCVFVCICLMIWKPKLLNLAKRDIPVFMIVAIFGLGLNHFFYYFAMKHIPVTTAMSLEYLAPLFVVMFMVVFLKKRLPIYMFCGILGSVFFAFLSVQGYKANELLTNKLGLLSAVGAAVTLALLTLSLTNLCRRYHPITCLFYTLLFAALFWIVVQPPVLLLSQSLSLTTWVGILFIALFGTLIPFLLYLYGIKTTGPIMAASLYGLQIPFAACISYTVNQQSFETLQIIGIVAMIPMVTLVQLKDKRQDQTKPSLPKEVPFFITAPSENSGKSVSVAVKQFVEPIPVAGLVANQSSQQITAALG